MKKPREPLGLLHLRLRIREAHGMNLTDYVLKRHEDDPYLTIDSLGEELHVARRTWRRWLEKCLGLAIGDGPRLVDLRIKAKQAALSEAARLIDEMEADEAPAHAT